MSVRKLKYNNTVIELLNFNNNEVQVANYNGVVVYDNTGEEPVPTPDPEPEPTGDPIFEIYPEVTPHDTSEIQPAIGTNESEYTIPEIQLVGNSNFFIRTNVQNAGVVNITQTKKGMDFVYRIDTYGLGFLRYIGYNGWGGGTTPGPQYDNTVTFTSSTDNTLSKNMVLKARTDENNTTFTKGLYTAKLIRIPASVSSGNVVLRFFPYSFESGYFYNQTDVYSIDASNVGKIVDGSLVKKPAVTQVDPEDNGTFVNMTLTDSGLESTLRYTVTANTTNNYRYAFFRFRRPTHDQTINSTCEIHFIQEPYSRNRIYYGNVPTEPKNWIGYDENPSEDTKYHVYFQFANSEIVKSSKEIAALRADNTSSRINVLCVSSELAHTISPSIGSLDIVSDNYMWGDQSYIIYKLASSADTTYTLNIG